MRQDQYCDEIAAVLCEKGKLIEANDSWAAMAIMTYLRENNLRIVSESPLPVREAQELVCPHGLGPSDYCPICSPAVANNGTQIILGTACDVPELAAPQLPVRPHRYDKANPLHDLEGWIVFYGQQAQRLESDPEMHEVFQASCETADLLLELQRRRLPVRPEDEDHLETLLGRAADSIEELTDDMEEDRCADPNCGGQCGLRVRAANIVSEIRNFQAVKQSQAAPREEGR